MRAFQIDGRTFSGYLAVPKHGSGPGVIVLHAWWGLTEPFRHVCDRLAEAGFVALAPDLYHGKTTASVEEAEALGAATSRQRYESCASRKRQRQAVTGNSLLLASRWETVLATCGIRRPELACENTSSGFLFLADP